MLHFKRTYKVLTLARMGPKNLIIQKFKWVYIVLFTSIFLFIFVYIVCGPYSDTYKRDNYAWFRIVGFKTVLIIFFYFEVRIC